VSTLKTLRENAADLCSSGIKNKLPVAAFAAALNYFDAYCTERLPANLIQAQRDLFGAHTYERIDATGSFHTDWK
jgi:6-phosphogluconate dehydrogenase